MDSFSTILSVFYPHVESEETMPQIPVEEEAYGGSGTNYCVIS